MSGSPPTTYVISDLHISAGKLDDCDATIELELIRFLKSISEDGDEVQLVINGDFLDFVQAPPLYDKDLRAESADSTPLCYSEAQSVRKLSEIHRAHAPIFSAMGEFLNRNSQNSILILPGNHDPDFFWPDVQSAFTNYVCSSTGADPGRIGFHLSQSYRPPHAPFVWIEHGHQHDPCNLFEIDGKPCWSSENPPIRKDKEGTERLVECIGTRFMNLFLNKLDEAYPFVDNVKPFSRFVQIFGVSALKPGTGTLKAAVAVWNMLKFLSGTLVKQPGDLLNVEKAGDGQDVHPIPAHINSMTDAKRSKLQSAIKSAGFDLDQPLQMYLKQPENIEKFGEFLADNFDLLDSESAADSSLLGIGSKGDMLALKDGFTLDESQLLVDAADEALKTDGVTEVIMGHTHATLNKRPMLNYMNTGCWTRYFVYADQDKLRPWSMLKESSYETFPYELRYVRITREIPLPVRMLTFSEKKG